MAVNKAIPILIVDDYSTMRRIICSLLMQLGFTQIEEAIDGQDAIKKLQAKNFSLIISDWNMEPMSGLELLRIVRSDIRLKNTPFIMVTAESKPENILSAKQAGVSNYIVKPFAVDTLKAKLMTVLGPF